MNAKNQTGSAPTIGTARKGIHLIWALLAATLVALLCTSAAGQATKAYAADSSNLKAGTISLQAQAGNPYGGGYSNCTWTAWQLAYERAGAALPGWGNAGQWYDNAARSGYSVGTAPRGKSIAVWTDSGYGHVGYVTEIRGDQMYVCEGGYNGSYHEGWLNIYAKRNYGTQSLRGFIYLGGNGVRSGYLNLGTSFRATIARRDINMPVIHNGSNIVLGYASTAQTQWNFSRQSDGSYFITSVYDGKAIDVAGAGTTNGVNVGPYTKFAAQNNAQQWFIYANAGGYLLAPKCAPHMAMDCSWDGRSAGTNIQIYVQDGTPAQVFSINKVATPAPAKKPAAKKANPLNATAAASVLTVKYSKVKKSNQSIIKSKAFKVSGAQGTVTFAKSSGNAKITISKTGTVTVKKGLKKGTYTVKVKVTAAGNAKYKSASKPASITVRVK